jgi:uncharacterized protein (DUF1778 family)
MEAKSMSVSKAQQKAQNKWIAKAYDRINLTVPKGQKDVIQAHAAKMGESVNAFIGRAIRNQIAQDSVEAPTVAQITSEGTGIQEAKKKPTEGVQGATEGTEEAIGHHQ